MQGPVPLSSALDPLQVPVSNNELQSDDSAALALPGAGDSDAAALDGLLCVPQAPAGDSMPAAAAAAAAPPQQRGTETRRSSTKAAQRRAAAATKQAAQPRSGTGSRRYQCGAAPGGPAGGSGLKPSRRDRHNLAQKAWRKRQKVPSLAPAATCCLRSFRGPVVKHRAVRCLICTPFCGGHCCVIHKYEGWGH